MKTNNVWFHSTYKFKNSDILIRTIGYAYNPDMTERMIIYVSVETNIPYCRSESDFLDTFEYVGC